MNIEKLLPRLAMVVTWLCVAATLVAQTPTFVIEDAVAFPDEEVLVNVRVDNPSMIVGIQLSVNWNTDQLDFLGVTNIILDGTFEDNFNRTQLDSGRLAYIVADATAQPLALENGDILFSMRFMPIPNSGLFAPVGFGDAPRPFRVADVDNQLMDMMTEDGRVDLGSVGLLDVVSENPRFRASPNPFTDQVQLDLRSNYASDGTLEVLSIDGRVVFRRPLSIGTTDNKIILSATDFPSAGSYVVRVTTDREQLHRKVVLGRGGR